MKRVRFTYNNGTSSLHNAEGTPLSQILKLVGNTVIETVVTWSGSSFEEKGISHKIVRADFIH